MSIELVIRRCFSELNESSVFRSEAADNDAVERSTDDDEARVSTFEVGTGSAGDSEASLVSLRSEPNMRKMWPRQGGAAS